MGQLNLQEAGVLFTPVKGFAVSTKHLLKEQRFLSNSKVLPAGTSTRISPAPRWERVIEMPETVTVDDILEAFTWGWVHLYKTPTSLKHLVR